MHEHDRESRPVEADSVSDGRVFSGYLGVSAGESWSLRLPETARDTFKAMRLFGCAQNTSETAYESERKFKLEDEMEEGVSLGGLLKGVRSMCGK